MDAMELSDNAKKILQYFQDGNLKTAEYVWPPIMELLFENDFEAVKWHKRDSRERVCFN